jgi:hypothetical protein
MLRRWVDQESIHAIHQKDLKNALKDLGVLDDIAKGSKRCFHCGKIINLEEIACLFMREGQVNFCCSDPNCFEEVLAMQQEE